MIPTLQWYIFRETGKTFVLTAIGLTLVFALGGGVFNMIRVEGVTAQQAARLLGFVLPVATTLTLPVAALFSAAIVYGRFSADNEINACRSSGINVYVLFLPALVLAAGAGVFTFYFSNFVIPSFVRGLDSLVRADLPKIVAQELQTAGHLKYQNYVMHAARLEPVPPEEAKAGTKQFRVYGTHVMELDGDDLARYFTAEFALLTFEESNGTPQILCDLAGAAGFDKKRNQSFQGEWQPLPAFTIPRAIRMKEKWFDLPDLWRYRREPQALPEVQNRMAQLRASVADAVICTTVERALGRGEGEFRFGDGDRRYALRAKASELNRNTIRLDLHQPTLLQQSPDGGETVTADGGRLEVVRTRGLQAAMRDEPVTPKVRVILEGNVRRIDSRDPDRPIAYDRYEPEAGAIDASLLGEALAYSDDELLQYDRSLGLGSRADGQVDEGRESLAGELDYRVRRILGIIHSRSAFSASVLLLVPLGAALGIIFRGGQVLTAFGVSFLPGLFVTVLIIMGRQLTENEATSLLGVAVIWGGLALMALVDGVVLTRFVRR